MKILKISLIIILSTLWTVWGLRAWNGILAEPWDILTAAKWNELVQYIDDGLASVSGWWGSLSITSTDITVANMACETTSIEHDRFLSAYVEEISLSPWAQLTPVGTIDPDNTSSLGANLIDGNYTNLVYNDQSQWSANKSLPAVDLWSSQSAWVVRIYWWNPNQYWVTNWQIQGSNDGTNWTPLVTNIVKTTGTTWDFDDYQVSWSYRYYRWFSVAWLNATWFVISELEVFAPWASSSEFIHVFNRDIEVKNNSGNIEVCNETWQSFNIEINHL